MLQIGDFANSLPLYVLGGDAKTFYNWKFSWKGFAIRFIHRSYRMGNGEWWIWYDDAHALYAMHKPFNNESRINTSYNLSNVFLVIDVKITWGTIFHAFRTKGVDVCVCRLPRMHVQSTHKYRASMPTIHICTVTDQIVWFGEIKIQRRRTNKNLNRW